MLHARGRFCLDSRCGLSCVVPHGVFHALFSLMDACRWTEDAEVSYLPGRREVQGPNTWGPRFCTASGDVFSCGLFTIVLLHFWETVWPSNILQPACIIAVLHDLACFDRRILTLPGVRLALAVLGPEAVALHGVSVDWCQ